MLVSARLTWSAWKLVTSVTVAETIQWYETHKIELIDFPSNLGRQKVGKGSSNTNTWTVQCHVVSLPCPKGNICLLPGTIAFHLAELFWDKGLQESTTCTTRDSTTPAPLPHPTTPPSPNHSTVLDVLPSPNKYHPPSLSCSANYSANMVASPSSFQPFTLSSRYNRLTTINLPSQVNTVIYFLVLFNQLPLPQCDFVLFSSTNCNNYMPASVPFEFPESWMKKYCTLNDHSYGAPLPKASGNLFRLWPPALKALGGSWTNQCFPSRQTTTSFSTMTIQEELWP